MLTSVITYFQDYLELKYALTSTLNYIIIRLALVIHVYSKFGTHIIITTSPIINCQRHNFL